MCVLAHVRDPDRRTVCVREVQKSLDRSVKQLIEDKIKALGVGHLFHVTSTEIRSRKGSGIILFRGMSDYTAESIKSLEGFNCAWVEEAQALSQRSLELLLPTIRAEGSEVWFTWNPRHKTDPVDAFLRGKDRPRDSVVVEVNYKQNPWLTSTLFHEAEHCRRTNPAKYAHVWLGEYELHAEARVFNNWRVEDFEAPKGTIFRFGCDWGFSPDPLVLVRCFLEGRTLYVDYEAWSVECEIEGTKALFLTVPESEKWPIRAGRDRPDRIRSAQKARFKIYPSVSGPNSVIEGVEWLQGLTIVVHSRCPHVADDLRLYSRKVDPLTGKVLPVLEDTNNHTIEALRYAVEDVRRFESSQADADFTPVPTVAHWGDR